MAADTSWAAMPYPGAADEDEGRNSHDESAADAVAKPRDERSGDDENSRKMTNEPKAGHVARNSEHAQKSELGRKNAGDPRLDNVAGFARTNRKPAAVF